MPTTLSDQGEEEKRRKSEMGRLWLDAIMIRSCSELCWAQNSGAVNTNARKYALVE